MSKAKENNCRLCLKIMDDDYNVIEDVTREIFELLLLKVDLSVSEEPLVCKNCMESVQKAFDFKSTCISVEEQVISLAMDRKSAKLDIRDVFLRENGNKSFVFSEDYNACRFCLQWVEKSNFNLLNDLKGNFADDMLLKLIPELDLNIIKEPMVCAACIKSLESYYSLTMICLNTEESIMKYRETQGAECKGLISLSSVSKFLSESILGCSQTAMLKDGMSQDDLNTYFDINNVFKIEEEEIVIKDENNFEDCITEENMCGDTMGKEVVNCDKDSSQIGMYRCDTCTFNTKCKQNLKIHNLTIHTDKPEVTAYKCNLCSFETKWKHCLSYHQLTHKNSPNTRMHRCKSCTFKTKLKCTLKEHMLTHKVTTSYMCNFCSYEAPSRYYLNNHMWIHKEPYRCAICTYETKQKSNLQSHMVIHKNTEVGT